MSVYYHIEVKYSINSKLKWYISIKMALFQLNFANARGKKNKRNSFNIPFLYNVQPFKLKTKTNISTIRLKLFIVNPDRETECILQ